MTTSAEFLNALTMILNLGAAEGSLAVSAAYVQEKGARVFISAGDKALMIDPDTALKLAETWGCPLGRANGLGPLADDLKEAGEMARDKAHELREKML